ncbi:MAG: sialidase, partial [Oscillospiraceae bacterium]
MFIEKKDDVVSIGNSFLERKFNVSDNKLLPIAVINKRTEEEISFEPKKGSEEFVISILTHKNKKDFILASALKLSNVNIDIENGKLCFEFLPYDFYKITYNIELCYEIKEIDHFMRKYLVISSSNDEKAVIDYIDTEHFALNGDEKQVWSRPETEKIYLSEYHSAMGQPIYIDGLFMGNEFPVSDNNILNDVAFVRYYSGRTLSALKKENDEYTTWKTVMGSARSLEMEVIRADFLEYIRSISQKLYLRTQYNSWYDHMMNITAENISGSFYEIEKGLTQNGVKPVNSYVVDDGWNDYTQDFWCFNEKFPDELYEISELAKKFSSEFGLWMGPRGGYNYNEKFGQIMQKAGTGGYNKQSRDVCIADHNYVKNITEFFLDYMKRFDINYWKLDGFMLNPCKSKKHGHVTGGFNDNYVMVECWEQWIEIFEKMRSLRDSEGKSLWLNQTSFCNASPWFLQWSESLWMQNSSDMDLIKKDKQGTKLSDRDYDAVLTYRDDRYFDFHKTRECQFPLSNMYNHEPIYGNTAKINMTDDEFRKYMYMISTRGTAFWELYYSFNLFTEDMWKINADVLKFVEENFHILRNARLIGNTPAKGAVYGYSAFEGSNGIISIR